MKSIYINLLALILLPILSLGQSIQVNSQNVNQLIHSLAGPGVTVSNINVNGTSSNSYGYFTNGNPPSTFKGIGINEGAILTTGKIGNASGPNNTPLISTSNGTAGDLLLESLVNYSGGPLTKDACVISFDIMPQGNSITLDYVFASEEYNEFVTDIFNDVMGIFISGPGITGTQNIAVVPGTNTPVCVNNINNGYSESCSGGVDCVNCSYFETNCSGKVVQYDGFTKVLQAKASNLTPCKKYRITLAIADVEDDIYDSALFIGKKSITSPLFAPMATTPGCIACESFTPPGNLACKTDKNGYTTLTWDAVPGALSYALEIIVNDSKCCKSSTLPSYALPGVTTYTNSHTLNTTGYQCFTWRVKTICPEGEESQFSDTICSSYCSTTGVINTFTLSPNPNASGNVKINLITAKDTEFNIDIFDTLGKKVKSFENNKTSDKKFEINWKTGNLNKGIYYVNIITAEGERLQERLIIK